MYALVNAFMRCLSFLLPPPWLCVSFCLWVGKDSEDALPRPNPRARFKSRKPLTYEEVAAVGAAAAAEAQGGSSSSVSPGPGCVSPAATSPAAPQGPPQARNWTGALWRAVERVFGAPWVLLRRRWSPKKRRSALRAPYPPPPPLLSPPPRAFELNPIIPSFIQGRGAAVSPGWEAPGGTAALTRSRSAIMMSGSVGIPGAHPVECASGASLDQQQGVDEVITVDQLSQEMGTVTITVAIQAAEDEEPDDESTHNNVDCLRGSCSEDEIGRHDKSRYLRCIFNNKSYYNFIIIIYFHCSWR